MLRWYYETRFEIIFNIYVYVDRHSFNNKNGAQ